MDYKRMWDCLRYALYKIEEETGAGYIPEVFLLLEAIEAAERFKRGNENDTYPMGYIEEYDG